MSKGSTPLHTGSHFDPFYDPDFTAEISAKMHVPDKICVVEGLQNTVPVAPPREEVRTMMNVPERIIVAGDNKHIAVRDFVPELKFEKAFPTSISNYVLEAPPTVLTVDEYPYPSVEFKKSIPKDVKKRSTVEQSPAALDLNESAVSVAADDEISMMRKQLRHLSRRVLSLEQESQQRQQREIILYTVGVTYFVLKGLIWLHKHF